MNNVLAPADEAGIAAAVTDAASAGEPLSISGNGTKSAMLRPVQAARNLSARNHTGITLYVPDLLHYCGVLHDRKVRFVAEPTQQAWGIMAMIADPDGNVLALWEDRLPETPPGSVSQADGTA